MNYEQKKSLKPGIGKKGTMPVDDIQLKSRKSTAINGTNKDQFLKIGSKDLNEIRAQEQPAGGTFMSPPSSVRAPISKQSTQKARRHTVMIVGDKKQNLWQNEMAVADNYEIALNNKIQEDDQIGKYQKQQSLGAS